MLCLISKTAAPIPVTPAAVEDGMLTIRGDVLPHLVSSVHTNCRLEIPLQPCYGNTNTLNYQFNRALEEYGHNKKTKFFLSAMCLLKVAILWVSLFTWQFSSTNSDVDWTSTTIVTEDPTIGWH